MRLLTFMGMAVEFKEISFDTMQQELQIGADDVEAFVIDGTRRLTSDLCDCAIHIYETEGSRVRCLSRGGGEDKGLTCHLPPFWYEKKWPLGYKWCTVRRWPRTKNSTRSVLWPGLASSPVSLFQVHSLSQHSCVSSGAFFFFYCFPSELFNRPLFILSPPPRSRSHQDGVLQNRPDAEKSRREVSWRVEICFFFFMFLFKKMRIRQTPFFFLLHLNTCRSPRCQSKHRFNDENKLSEWKSTQ